MANINMVQVMGRLTKQPELRTTPSGVQVASIGIATNRQWTGKDGIKQKEAEFHNAVAFGRTAEVICQYFAKGDEIYVIGRLKTSSYEGKDGAKRTKTDILVERIDFGQKARTEANGGQSQPAEKAPVEETADFGNGPEPVSEIRIEDIPF